MGPSHVSCFRTPMGQYLNRMLKTDLKLDPLCAVNASLGAWWGVQRSAHPPSCVELSRAVFVFFSPRFFAWSFLASTLTLPIPTLSVVGNRYLVR